MKINEDKKHLEVRQSLIPVEKKFNLYTIILILTILISLGLLGLFLYFFL